jgi:stearoyl-CoA desaturase (delta-9 desaturase)
MHRMHHAYSDTEKDPHSPRYFITVLGLMWHMKKRFYYYNHHEAELGEEDRKYLHNLPPPTWFERWVSDSWFSRIFWGAIYTIPYILYADVWWIWILLPAQFVICPIQGTIVNWCGHKYGYQNFKNGDDSRNSLWWDIFLLGELFQNNHHYASSRPNFSFKRWEFDPVYPVLFILNKLSIIRFKLS